MELRRLLAFILHRTHSAAHLELKIICVSHLTQNHNFTAAHVRMEQHTLCSTAHIKKRCTFIVPFFLIRVSDSSWRFYSACCTRFLGLGRRRHRSSDSANAVTDRRAAPARASVPPGPNRYSLGASDKIFHITSRRPTTIDDVTERADHVVRSSANSGARNAQLRRASAAAPPTLIICCNAISSASGAPPTAPQ